ncbi:uncharacterized protein LOC129598291 [Paramacrobiotus metropolitanus]|uniref:uncharacterized protein LOC129598291 n=1 Tax=Paramacrobiotus metropolitanus TaxID=2943436 RepID=UPI00244654FF|nr:uncharacterized protein LOC129598291 [Paramacrobiotus metropolitanus]
MPRYGMHLIWIVLIYWQVVNSLSEDDHSAYMEQPYLPVQAPGPGPGKSANVSLYNNSSSSAVADQHYGDAAAGYQPSYRAAAQGHIRIDPAVKDAGYLSASASYPAAGNYSSPAVKEQHYGQPVAPANYRPYRNDAHNYARTVNATTKQAPYLGAGYGGYAANTSVTDQHYGQPYAGDYSRPYRAGNYVPTVDTAVKNSTYGQQYASAAPAVADQDYGQPYAGEYRPYRAQNYRPNYDPAVKDAAYGLQYGGATPAQPYPAAAPVKQQYYGQTYAGDYRSYRSDAANYARTVQPVKDAGYLQPQAAYTPANGTVREQFYGQPHAGGGYRHYRTDGRNYAPKMQGVQDAPYLSPAGDGGEYHEEHYEDEDYAADGLCAPAQTRVDRTLYCGIPNVLRGTQVVHPEKLGGEWFQYRRSPIGPLQINPVLRVRPLGRAEIPSTHYPAMAAWYASSWYQSSQDYSCSDIFYAGFLGLRGTQVMDTYFPERAPIEYTIFYTLLLDERLGLWINYECQKYSAASGVCARPHICVNVRERPDLLSRDEQARLDAAINQAVAPFCLSITQLPKQIYTNSKSPCPEPKVPDWLNMKIQGLARYQRKLDLSTHN